MTKHKKFYRSATATGLMLLAGLVLAPTVVTAGFHGASKKAAPAQPAPEVALEPAAPKPPKRHAPQPVPQPAQQPAATEQSAPQSEAQPDRHPGWGGGETTFAYDDFAPDAGHGGAAFPHGGASFAVASAGGGSVTDKFIRKPQTGNTGTSGSTGGDKSSSGKPADPAPGGDSNPPGNDNAHNGPGGQPGDTFNPGDGDHNPPPRPVVSVPEPSSVLLLATGIIGLVVARRRS